MDEERGASQVSWGAHVNSRWSYQVKGFPDWANPYQREKWAKKGLILWECESRVILRLSATQALDLLDDFCTEDAWKEDGIVLGEPVTHLDAIRRNLQWQAYLSDPFCDLCYSPVTGESGMKRPESDRESGHFHH